MERHGLSHAERRALEATLAGHHDIRVAVELLNLDGDVLGSITPKVLDGQVQADRQGFGDEHGPQKRLTLTLLDPRNALNLDTRDPDDGTLYFDRLVRVTYRVRVPALSDWVEIAVFTGPPWKLQRTDDEVYIEADDASVLGWGNAWRPKTLRKGMKKTAAIREVLSDRAGFVRFDLPERQGKLAHPISLSRQQHPWEIADRIARSMDLQLYTDGRGVVVARRLPGQPMWNFTGGQNGVIVDPLAISGDREDFYNVVEVLGRKPKGEKRRYRGVAYAPRKHPNSPWQLVRNGAPYFKVLRVQNDHFRSTAECKKKAERLLVDGLRSRAATTCSILPWPHITPGDQARFRTLGGEPTVQRIDTFALPLGVGQPMTIGWFDKPAPHRRKVRR